MSEAHPIASGKPSKPYPEFPPLPVRHAALVALLGTVYDLDIGPAFPMRAR